MLREANWKDRISYAIGKLKAFRVQGDSMLPTLRDGEVVLISPKASVEPGDIVLAKHPYKQSVKMLKRVAAIDDSGRYSLVGDNAGESTDSRTFGTLPVAHIEGKAVCRVK
ncbi:MAG: nickel-type superoxide dismutase maturation protease [Acidobacteriota bacterium]